MQRPQTLGQLKQSGYRPRTVRQELRENLIERLRSGEPVFPGIIGFDRTVLPQIQNAILSGHDFILLGLRGQAKTRILRSLANLLDEAIPAIADSPLNEDPLAPMTSEAKRRVRQEGDALPIVWIPREDRYREKLATPDVTVSDLIGDIDPLKAANRNLELDNPEVIQYGIIPRTNRGIFAINELPDLQARIQVALLNLLEEGDIQIRSFPVRLPLDVLLVFSANPEDYTNRGSIITPLRDRIASQILTHYPRTIADSMAITDQEAWAKRDGEVQVTVPDYLRLTIEEVAFRARESALIDQNSGISARMTIALYENVLSNAERRALITGSDRATVRTSDLFSAIPAITGKVELVYEGEREGPRNVALSLVGQAVQQVFGERIQAVLPDQDKEAEVADLQPVLAWFAEKNTVDVADDLDDEELYQRLAKVPGLKEAAKKFLAAEGRAGTASAMEFLLESLHQAAMLSREDLITGSTYRDSFEDMVRSFNA
ncbi:MAG: magnesium chelatase [Planctomycetes bacterium]|nr:magnesium chelatase [Planctomycetota bacterium]MCB9908758.1 magnesium chelatase [Planctomycetota bacterium]MCB9912417.1 magnesium chelatase [Planctomycetota bacterium]HPF14459.1 magnesium chelatase [Planctomycetota bacterium]